MARARPSPSPRRRLAVFVVGSLAALLASSLPASWAEDGPTNFVVIVAADLGAGDLGCYGSTVHRTPNLDRLAAEGMRFETCWATPVGDASRVQLLTGRYGFRTGWFDARRRPFSPMPSSRLYSLADQVTFSHLLDTGRYATALAGQWQLPGKLPDLVFDCGFDEYRIWSWRHRLPPGAEHDGRWEDKRDRTPARYWDPSVLENAELQPAGPEDYGPDLYCEFLADFIRRHRSQRFLAYYPMCLPHRPWEPTPDPAGETTDRRKGGLAASVEYLDALVGRLLRVLEESDLRGETLVVFTAAGGSRRGGGGEEKGVRVPLLMSCPGTIPPGIASLELVSLADAYPTILEWAGIRPPFVHEIDGQSLVPVLRGEEGEHRPWVYGYVGAKKLVRDRRWLLDSRGRLYDTGYRRNGVDYRDRTASPDAESEAARARLERILAGLPGPEGLAEHLRQPNARQKAGR